MLQSLGDRIWTAGEEIAETGLVYHPTMDIHDASKIQTFLDSPRKYFFQYVLGWRGIDPNIHLEFGSGWHLAMEHLLRSLNTDDGYSDKAVLEAWQLFNDYYESQFPQTLGPDPHSAKNPENALRALVKYAQLWERDKREMRTMYTEVAGSVPVQEDRVLHFKLDSIVRRNGRIASMEHKTTGRWSQRWADQWDLITQPWLYTHALNAIFPDDDVSGVIINGAILRAPTKAKPDNNEFIRVPVAKSERMMVEGLWRVNHILDYMSWHWENLVNSTPDDDILPAFPCNGTSCSKYGCPFAQFCATWPNPLEHADSPPSGFEQAFWDPRREQDDAKYIVKAGESEIQEVQKR